MRQRLLSWKCLLVSMVSQWDIYGKPLCLHINFKRFTYVVLLFSSSSLCNISETAIIFLFFLKDIRKPIIDLAIWLDVRSVLRSLVPTWSITYSGFMSQIVGLTWSCIQLTFAVLNGPTLTVPLCLIFFR